MLGSELGFFALSVTQVKFSIEFHKTKSKVGATAIQEKGITRISKVKKIIIKSLKLGKVAVGLVFNLIG